MIFCTEHLVLNKFFLYRTPSNKQLGPGFENMCFMLKSSVKYTVWNEQLVFPIIKQI